MTDEHTSVSASVRVRWGWFQVEGQQEVKSRPNKKKLEMYAKIPEGVAGQLSAESEPLPVPVSLLWEHGPTARCRRGSRGAPGWLATLALDGVSLNNISCLVQVAWVVKHPLANEGDIRDMGLITGLGRFLGEGKGYPLQYSGLENSMDYSPWGCKESDTTEWLSLHFDICLRDKSILDFKEC